jgi:hypothetical protein
VNFISASPERYSPNPIETPSAKRLENPITRTIFVDSPAPAADATTANAREESQSIVR